MLTSFLLLCSFFSCLREAGSPNDTERGVPSPRGAGAQRDKEWHRPEGCEASWRLAEAGEGEHHSMAEATGLRKRAAVRAIRAYYVLGHSRYRGEILDSEASLAARFTWSEVLEQKNKVCKRDFGGGLNRPRTSRE